MAQCEPLVPSGCQALSWDLYTAVHLAPPPPRPARVYLPALERECLWKLEAMKGEWLIFWKYLVNLYSTDCRVPGGFLAFWGTFGILRQGGSGTPKWLLLTQCPLSHFAKELHSNHVEVRKLPSSECSH